MCLGYDVNLPPIMPVSDRMLQIGNYWVKLKTIFIGPLKPAVVEGSRHQMTRKLKPSAQLR